MARHKKRKPQKKESLPYLDFFLDLIRIGLLACFSKRRRGRKRDKIDPYCATAQAMSAGMINNTEDLLRFGGMLGAMGAFDPDDEDDVDDDDLSPDYDTVSTYRAASHTPRVHPPRQNTRTDSTVCTPPTDVFTTHTAYDPPIPQAKEYSHAESQAYAPQDASMPWYAYSANCSDAFADDDFHLYTYCHVKLADSGRMAYYRTEDLTLLCGDKVLVPVPSAREVARGEIMNMARHTRFTAPQPVEETYEIIGRAR